MFDIKAIPEHLKNMLVNAWLLPLWYVSIYLFSPSTYSNEDIILISSLCLGFNLLSSMNSVLWTIIDNKEKDFEVFGLVNTMVIFTFQLLLLSILMICVFIFNLYSDYILKFHGFIIIYYLSLNIFFLADSVIDRIKKNKKNTSP